MQRRRQRSAETAVLQLLHESSPIVGQSAVCSMCPFEHRSFVDLADSTRPYSRLTRLFGPRHTAIRGRFQQRAVRRDASCRRNRKTKRCRAMVHGVLGQSVESQIVDELAAPDILLQYSLHAPRRGREDVKAFMTAFRAPSRISPSRAPRISSPKATTSSAAGSAAARTPVPRSATFCSVSLPAASGRTMRFTGTTVLRSTMARSQRRSVWTTGHRADAARPPARSLIAHRPPINASVPRRMISAPSPSMTVMSSGPRSDSELDRRRTPWIHASPTRGPEVSAGNLP